MPAGASHDVFISYASGDKAAADQVCAALERRGVRCWIAPRNARPGINYGASIVDAIDATPVLVFLVSSRAIASPHVQREVERAANKGVHVIPFRIEDVPLSKSLQYFLESVHWLDAFTPPLDRHLDDLAEAVMYFLSSQAPANVGGGSAEGIEGSAVAGRPVTESAGAARREGSLAGDKPFDALGPHPGLHRAQDTLLAAIPSFSVDVLRAAVVGAAAGAGLVAVVALFARDAGPAVALAFILRTAVLSGLITLAWLVGTSLPGQRAALLGALAGGLGGWMAESLVTQLWHVFVYMRFGGTWTAAGVIQWIAFGLAGGLIIDRTRTARPAVAIAIALVVVSVARTLILSWALPDYPLRDFLLRNPLLFDLPVALGWGISLVLCPLTDTSFRRPTGPHGPTGAE
jgi:TIR domain